MTTLRTRGYNFRLTFSALMVFATGRSVRSPLGLPEFSHASLPVCHGLWTPADLHTLAQSGVSVLPSVYVKTLGVRITLISKLYQHFRVRVTLTAYRMLCLRLARLVHSLPATPPRTQDSIRVGG